MPTILTALLDLVLPGAVGVPEFTVRVACRRTPVAPPGLPRRCLSAGEYAGPLREAIIAYKERGQRALSAPLGDALAEVVRAAVKAGREDAAPPGRVVLVPVPATAAARRARRGDHMLRLARRAAARLRRGGYPVMISRPLRALPKVDSVRLDRSGRLAAAAAGFVPRPARLRGLGMVAARGSVVVLVDDVLTTGATLAAVAGHLLARDVPVAAAATLAATRLRKSSQKPPEMVFLRGDSSRKKD